MSHVRSAASSVLVAIMAVGCSGSAGGGGLAPTWKVSGNAGGAGGVTVTLIGGTPQVAVTDASGAFSFLVPNGTWAVEPAQAGLAFDPVSRIVEVGGGDVGGVDFTAASAAATYSVSGTITGTLTARAVVTLAGAATGQTTTVAGGGFSFSGLVPGDYTLTPSLDGFDFTPVSLDVTVGSTDVTGLGFAGAATHTGGATTYACTYGVLEEIRTQIPDACVGPRFCIEDTAVFTPELLAEHTATCLAAGDGVYTYATLTPGGCSSVGRLSSYCEHDTLAPVGTYLASRSYFYQCMLGAMAEVQQDCVVGGGTWVP